MDVEKFLKTLGWFDDAGTAVHDPIPGIVADAEPSTEELAQALCIVCEQPLTMPVFTCSIRYLEKFTRSYFYRVHKTCGSTPEADEAASNKALTLIEMYAMESKVSA